jgi:hypothetical protein
MASDGELVKIDAEGVTLPRLIDRASKALLAARSSAEVLEAGRLADVAYSASKMAGRMAKQTKAHDTVIAACHRTQADALQIEAGAKRRLADEVDAAQARGEVQKPGGDRISIISKKNNAAKISEVGLTPKQIHEARVVRDAEKNDPGVVRRTLDDLVATGKEPTKAALRRATGKKSGKNRTSSKSHPVRESEPDEEEDAKSGIYDSSTPAQRKKFFIFQTNQIIRDAEFDGVPDDDIRAATRRVVTTWTKFLADLEKRNEPPENTVKATTSTPRKLAPAQLAGRRQRMTESKTCNDYGEQFGLVSFMSITPDVLRRMEDSLTSGVDDFADFKAEQEREHAEYVREETQRRADINAPLLAPITPEKEQEYTRLIKSRELYEGACDLSWEEYFTYRGQHPDCTPLSRDELDYASMWTKWTPNNTARIAA